MNALREARWVRLLAVTTAFIAIVAVAEGRALRSLRSEVQQLRDERDRVKRGEYAVWTRQSADELRTAVRWLDEFYADPEDGLGRTGGLCHGDRVNDDAIVTYVFGTFLTARVAGASVQSALEETRAAIARTDAYKTLHPPAKPK